MYTELHGGDYRPMSTSHRSGIKMKKKIILYIQYIYIYIYIYTYIIHKMPSVGDQAKHAAC